MPLVAAKAFPEGMIFCLLLLRRCYCGSPLLLLLRIGVDIADVVVTALFHIMLPGCAALLRDMLKVGTAINITFLGQC